MEQVDGRVAVVTGAASGIGLAMAERFADAGMKLVLADIESGPLDEAVAAVSARGAEAIGVVTDVSRAEQVEALRDAAVDAFGTVHVVCNNAGVGAGGRSWECPIEDWEWVLGVNLWGVVHGIRAFTPLLLAQDEGHIVNTASMAGLTSPPYMSMYNVSKHSVVTLSETLFAELALEESAVGVSVLCPGWVNTRINEASRNRPVSEQVGEVVDAVDAAPDGPDADLFRDSLADLLSSGMDPADVADQVLDAITASRFYIVTHKEWAPGIVARAQRIVDGENPSLTFLPTD